MYWTQIHPAFLSVALLIIDFFLTIFLLPPALGTGNKCASNVSVREYYYYKLQIRVDDRSMLLHTCRLLQQFVVDVYVKIETYRLDFHRQRQEELRTNFLKGIMDVVTFSETKASNVGRTCRLFLLVGLEICTENT